MLPRILHKGLAFVLVPLALQVVFLGGLLALAHQSQKIAEEEVRLSSIVDIQNQVEARLMASWLGLIAITVGDSQFSTDQHGYREIVPKLMERMKELSYDRPRMQQAISEVDAIVKAECAVLSEFDQFASGGASKAMFLGKLWKLRPALEGLAPRYQRLSALLDEERLDLDQARKQAAANRSSVERGIVAAVIADILITLGIVALFLNDISKRLRLLVENAALIPKGIPLQRTITGGDELAYLDNVLHDASTSLRLAAEHRKSITQMLAHDLRAPLAATKLQIESMVTNDAKLSPSQQERADKANRNLQLLVSLVDDLLTVDKLESGKLDLDLALVDFASIIDEALDVVKDLAAQKQIDLATAIVPAELICDRARILQVLINLMTNAIKFSPKNSVVTVSNRVDNRELVVSISDKGPGIEREKQERLFEKFYQVDGMPAQQGFGLGLNICKQIIARHGGRIGVNSEIGKGAAFWFSLPLEEDEDA